MATTRDDDKRDICERCRCGRVAEDDDGRKWKTVRERRLCGACVYELVLAAAQTEQWWTRQPVVMTPINETRS